MLQTLQTLQPIAQTNNRILETFMIDSYAQCETDDFRWSDLNFSFEIKENILNISFSGEYLGAYPNYITDELFFDLNTGEMI